MEGIIHNYKQCGSTCITKCGSKDFVLVLATLFGKLLLPISITCVDEQQGDCVLQVAKSSLSKLCQLPFGTFSIIATQTEIHDF